MTPLRKTAGDYRQENFAWRRHVEANTFKCVTLAEPWASLVALCGKDVENRDWSTRHRGPLLIHAGKKFLDQGRRVVAADEIEDCWREWRAFYPQLPEAPQFGQVIAMTRLADCLPRWKCTSTWAHGPQCWLLRDTRVLEHPFEMRGQQKLFDVSLYSGVVPFKAGSEIIRIAEEMNQAKDAAEREPRDGVSHGQRQPTISPAVMDGGRGRI